MPSSTLPRSGWEAHVRAPIVESEDAPPIIDEKDRPMAAVQNEASLGLQLLKAAGAHEFTSRGIHPAFSRGKRVVGTEHRYLSAQCERSPSGDYRGSPENMDLYS